MLENLTLHCPTWYLIFCPLAGFILAGLLYYRDTRFKDEKSWLPRMLFFLRFFLVTSIAFLLLSPLIRAVKENIQEPIIVYAKDVSSSVIDQKTPEEVNALNVQLISMVEQLEKTYDVRTLSFGNSVEEGLLDSFTQKVTNISSALEYIQENYADQNIGAVVMSSDGIYNEGKNPLYSSGGITCPIFTIAQGDTTRRTDLSIKNTFTNSIVYLNDKFSMQIDIQAFNSQGKGSVLRVSRISDQGNQELFRENFAINSEDFFLTKEVILDADRVGVMRFRISVSPIAGEITNANNYKDVYVQVLDARQKVLLLAQAPHPDLSALSQIITQNKNYEISIAIKGKDNYNLNDYDQVIFHNLPGSGISINADVTSLQKNRTPYLMVVGAQMDLPAFNQIQDIISIKGTGRTLEDVDPTLNPAFKNFTIDQELRNNLATLPPLIAPFGEYSLVSSASTLLFQKIRNVETRYPMISFHEKNGVKTGIIVGEGIWKWRLFDYLQNENYQNTTDLVNKVIQYVSTKKDNRKFITSSAKNLYRENESINISAQLYNDNYELVNEPEVFLSVYGVNNQEYQYIMDRSNDFYYVNAGLLPSGSYRFSAKTNFNGQEYSDNGRFSVQEIQLESFDLEARHGILASLSEKASGKLYYENQIEDLTSDILSRESIKPILYQNVQTTPLINLKWIFVFFLILLTCEWFLRRFFGSY